MADAATTPKPFFQSALITGAANTIAASRVPVIDSAGNVTYKDVTLRFNVSGTGALSLAPGNLVITNSPTLVTSGFKPGNYKDSSGNKYVLSGPSAIPGSTRTAWSLAFTSGSQAKQFSASWTTGPIAGHPNQSSLGRIKMTSTAYTGYSWGIAGNVAYISSDFPFDEWGNQGNVIGAVQAGEQVVLHLFKIGDEDSVEDDSVSLVRCAAAC